MNETNALLNTAKFALHAASFDAGRSNLCALRIEPDLEGAETLIVATDGHRLACGRALVPFEALDIAARSIALPKKKSERNRLVRTFDAFGEALLDDSYELDFPDWRQVVPRSFAWKIKVLRDPLIQIIEDARAAQRAEKDEIVAKGKASVEDLKRVRDQLKGDARKEAERNLRKRREDLRDRPKKATALGMTDNGEIALVTRSVSSSVPVLSVDGEVPEIGICVDYLREAVQVADFDGSITIEGDDYRAPVRVSSDVRQGYVVVMPMRL